MWREHSCLPRPDFAGFGPVPGVSTPFFPQPHSKLHLQRQLNRPRPANLIQRIKPAIRAAGPQAVRQRLRRVAEQRASQHVCWVAEVGVIENVEELGAEAKPHLLSDAKHPLHPDIRLRSVEAAQHVAAEITLLPCGCRRKRRLIEDLAAGISRAVKFGRGASPIPSPRNCASTTLTGGADLARMKLSTDQPPGALDHGRRCAVGLAGHAVRISAGSARGIGCLGRFRAATARERSDPDDGFR